MPRSAGVACPLCGAAHAVCGQATASTPVDIPIGKEPSVGPVRKYKVITNGHETVLKLNDEDVKAYPDAELLDEPAEQGAKSDATETQASTKTRSAANKARTAADKSGN